MKRKPDTFSINGSSTEGYPIDDAKRLFKDRQLRLAFEQLLDAFLEPVFISSSLRKRINSSYIIYLHSWQRIMTVLSLYRGGLDARSTFAVTVIVLKQSGISMHPEFAFSTYKEFTGVMKKLIEDQEEMGLRNIFSRAIEAYTRLNNCVRSP
jgi:hypothetical protein